MQDSNPYRQSSALAASAAAVFTICLATSLSAPSLTTPFLPGLAFLWLWPLVMGLAVGAILKRMPGLRDGLVAGLVTTFVITLPWMLVASAPLALMPWLFWPGMIVAVLISLFLHQKRHLSMVALIAALVVCAIPQDSKIKLGGGELNPLVVVGMDSANWRFIDEMIAANPEDLPALQELMQSGAFAPMESETPTASSRIWTIIATGVHDEVHGIKNFGNFRSDLKAGRVWDGVINNNGEGPIDPTEPEGTAGVVAWLINTPADDREGLLFNTPGWVTGSHEAKPEAGNAAKVLEGMGEDAANRPSIQMALTAIRSALAVASAETAWNHIDDAFTIVFGKLFQDFGEEDLIWRMKIMRDRINADTYFALARRNGPDFNALVLYATDQLGHYFWKYHESLYGDRELFPSVSDKEIRLRGESVRDSYRACDRVLAMMMERVDREEVTIMLCSDHGMQPLEESRGDKQLKLLGSRVIHAAMGEDAVEHFTGANMDKALYISSKVPGEQGREMLNDLRVLLEEARDLTANRSLFTVSFPENSVDQLRIDFMDHALSGLLELENQLQIGETVGPASQLFAIEERSGRHTLTGFFLLAGPGVKQGVRLDPVSVYDLAPTMTYTLGKKVPDGIGFTQKETGQTFGRVVTEAFTESYLNAHPLRTVPGMYPMPPEVRSANQDEIDAEKSKLKDSGYVD
jgi:predicted AlkP superfamily phosphohydrolase/phosphomutase